MNPAPLDLPLVPLEGVQLIEASAGTGKTTTLTGLHLRLLLETPATIEQVLVLTFTRAATGELRDRVRRRLRQALTEVPLGYPRRRVEAALRRVDQAPISTLHGFAQDTLTEFAFETGSPLRPAPPQPEGPRLQRAVRDAWAVATQQVPAHLRRTLAAQRGPGSLLALTRLLLDQPLTPSAQTEAPPPPPSPTVPELLAWWDQALLRVAEDAARRFRSDPGPGKGRGPSDLIRRLEQALTDPRTGPSLVAALQHRYYAALVDEYQDTDPRQASLLFRLFPRGPLFLVGDPKQSIYSFRGADLQAWLEARRAADQVWTLPVNYRSDAGLVQALQALYQDHPCPFVRPEVRFSPVRAGREKAGVWEGPALTFLNVEAEPPWTRTDGQLSGRWEEQVLPSRVAAEIKALMTSGPKLDGRAVRPSDLALLVRTNAQARAMRRALQDLGLPAAIQGDASLFDTPEAADTLTLLRALHHPEDPAARAQAGLSRWLDQDARAVLAAEADPAWQARFTGWSALLHREGPLVALQTLLREQQVPARLLAEPDGERALATLQHLAEVLQQVAESQGLGPAGLIRWLDQALKDPRAASLDADTLQQRLASDDEAVTVATVHRCKGLEYPLVFLPYFSRGEPEPRFPAWVPGRSGQGGRWVTQPEPEAQTRLARASLAEATHLLYVALTRARHACWVVEGPLRDAARSPLRWLLRGLGGADPHLASDPAGPDWEGLLQRAPGQIARRSLAETAPSFALPEPQLQPLALGPIPSLLPGRSARASYSAWAGAGPGGASGPSGDQQGLAVGLAVHRALERLDLQASPEDQARTWGAELERAGWPPERAASAWSWVAPLAGTHLPGLGRLADLEPSDRATEWPFLLRAGARGPLTLAGLRQAWSEGPLHQRFPLPDLDLVALQGVLAGVIDLLARARGRWWVVDYKSNRLGDDPSAYRPEALDAPVREAGYALQAALYVLAVHHHLRATDPRYQPERDLGGARFVFLRGLRQEDQEAPAPSGIWCLDAEAAWLDPLDRWLQGG